MTTSDLTVLILPGARADRDACERTAESVRHEVGADARIVRCAVDGEDDGGTPPTGVETVDPADVVAADGVLAFARAGDRWRPGTWTARRRPLDAHPTAVLAVAGHVRVTADGEGVPFPAPMPPIDPGAVLLHPSIEASAVIVRASALDASAVSLLHRPYGDLVVWAKLIAAHGHLPSGELAADVATDPDRHGFRPAAGLAAMLAAVSEDDGDAEPAGRSALRRELLRRLFLESDPGADDVDLVAWLGDGTAAGPRARAVVEDLRWALARQREALDAERVGWRPETLGDGGPVEGALDLEQLRYQVGLMELQGEINNRDETIRWLNNELTSRDAAIGRLDAELRRNHATVERLDAELRHRDATAERLDSGSHHGNGPVERSERGLARRDETIPATDEVRA